ncbi:MAG: CHAT domain-containing protein [Bacteroidetes bacterium]|nr:CHAT domain-containing protein [Bacteroidota bacterium]
MPALFRFLLTIGLCLSTIWHIASWQSARAQESGDVGDYPDVSRGQWRSVEDSVRYQLLLMELLSAYEAGSDSTTDIARRALAFAQDGIQGGDHANVADAFSNCAFLLDAEGNTEAARPLYAEALAMRRRMHPGDHPSLAQTMNNMAYYWHRAGKPDHAEPLFLEAMEMKQRIYGGDHVEVAIGYNNLAVFYEGLGKTRQAESYYAESLAMYRRLYPDGAPELISPMVNFAYFLTSSGHFQDAEQLYLEANRIASSTYGDSDHDEVITLKNNLAYLYTRLGRLAEAERLMVDVLERARRRYPGDHPAVATAMNNLASFFQSRGMDAEAEPLYRESLEMRRRLHPGPHADVLLSLNNMGYFHMIRGRFSDAEEHFEAARAMLDSLYPGDHQQRAIVLNNLASLYAQQWRLEEAERLYVSVLEMVKRLYERPHPEIARQYNNLGTLYRDQGHSGEARLHFAEAVEEFRALNQPDGVELAVALGNLGRMNVESGFSAEGRAQLEESLEIRREMFDDGHTERIAAERIVAQMYAQQQEIGKALLHLQELMHHLDIAMKQSFGFDSERHQLEYMNTVLKPNLDLIGQFCVQYADHDREIPILLLQAMLRFKGAVANETARRSAEGSKNRFADELNGRLTTLREQDAALAGRPHDALLMEERRRIQRSADSLDATLRKLDREYDKLRRRQDADWMDVRRQLEADEALVEFVVHPFHYDYRTSTDTILYSAVVLTRTDDPVIVPLAREDQLRPYLDGTMHPQKENYVSDPQLSAELYSLVWQPLEEKLKNVRTCYLVPDGVLHRLSFHALVTGEGTSTTYLDDRYELHFLTGSRDLLSRNIRFKPSRYRSPQSVVLLGAPQFGELSSDEDTDEVPGGDITRGGAWGPLPGTMKEVERISEICSARNITHVTLVGPQAREEKVKALSGSSPRILHIATHGFFFPVPRIGDTHERQKIVTRGGAQQLRVEDNPMLRAGLVFSGVNEVWTGKSPPTRGDDGILSALEISRLDLTGTELVTLSACETGLGDITNGEGIFGLQRAFQVAGAECLLMTLWKVADEPTAMMMQWFYEGLLESNDAYRAFREARKRMRREYAHPFFWAGFIMVER